MKKKFDISTAEGFKLATDFIASTINSSFSPYGELLKFAEKIFEKLFGHGPEELDRSKRETIERLIRSGKEQGVDEMEIKTKDTRGLKLNVPAEDITIDFVVGNDNDTIIKVKYK